MSDVSMCLWCVHANENRQKDDKIRCTRFSQWVPPLHHCEAFRYNYEKLKWAIERSDICQLREATRRELFNYGR